MAHRFIELSSHCLSYKAAEAHAMRILQALGNTASKSSLQRPGAILTLQRPKSPIQTTFAELAAAIRIGGAADQFEWHLRTQTSGITMSFATDSETAGVGLEHVGYHGEHAKGPGRVSGSVVEDLLEDVLIFRRAVAETSSMEKQFDDCVRNYRAYLHACVSSVDAHFGLELWRLAQARPDVRLSDDRMRGMSIEEKIDVFYDLVGGRVSEKGRTWAEFKLLKDSRNAFVHPKRPINKFEARRALDDLNRCQLGVGTLIRDANERIGQWPQVNANKVAHAPPARFVTKPRPA